MKAEWEVSGRDGFLTVAVLGMQMAYSIVLLRLGLPVATVAVMACVSAVMAAIASRRSPLRLTRAARRMLHAAVADRDVTEDPARNLDARDA